MDLFEHSAQKSQVGQPLAERLRPKQLEELVGQEHLTGEGKLLHYLAKGAALPSLLLWGPPGTGKTTMARLLAQRDEASFESLSAVMSGVKELREVTARAQRRLAQEGRKTLLFIDEIHRFSKSQQDALLPHVECGTYTLIGATTENPSFQVNGALLSRCRVVRLVPLSDEALHSVLERALGNPESGLGRRKLTMEEDAKSALVARAGGDARRLLGALEVAADLAQSKGLTAVSLDLVEEALQAKTLSYDKAGDEHYGVVSAFIKSMRGSDPDAAIYWMTRMLEAGEDPLFILRRMVIFASEDIGNADPQALSVVTAALASFRFIGLPEGVLPMTQAVVYMACAPKSNSALTTYGRARRVVRDQGSLPVPDKLRNATTGLDKKMGRGQGYRYPHNEGGEYLPESYLPEALVSAESLYQPSDSGFEKTLSERVAKWRESFERAQTKKS